MDNTIFIISCRLHRWNLSIRCKELLEFLKIKEYEIKAVNKCILVKHRIDNEILK